MKAKDIKVGQWYETRVGIGVCLLGAAGRFPPACKFKIVAPFPRGECFVVRGQAEAWVQAHDREPIVDVAVRMECDESGRPIPGRSTVEITTGCNDACIIALLEVVKNMGERSGQPRTCGKCGSAVNNNGPCPACNDVPFGALP